MFVNRCVPRSRRSVRMTDELAMVAALDHLHALGHRRVGLVAGPVGNDPGARRADGFRSQAGGLGLELAPVVEENFTDAGGAAGARALLRRHPELTAIATGGLSQAIGALHVAWELGLHVPGDLSVLTIDDLALAEYLRPPLTTARMPLGELGTAAADAVPHQLRGGEPHDVVVETHPELVVRGSTGSPA